MRWIILKRSKVRVYGKPLKMMMKGMTAQEEHTHFLHSLLTNNVKNLREGDFNYNLWLKPNGQPVGDFFVYRVGDHFLLDSEKPA
ncbi:MAG: folate-binding protein, partial [Aquificota bacterium]|nr:folate-binding protein [Aquificota bacterium]